MRKKKLFAGLGKQPRAAFSRRRPKFYTIRTSQPANNIKAIENVFRVCTACYKHERGWENSRQLCKPSASSWVCITVEKILLTPQVFISGYANTGKKISIAFIK